MQHPLFYSARNLVIYAVAWLLIMSAHVAFLYFYQHQALYLSVVESIVVNTVFAFLGVGIWFTVRYTNIDNQAWFNILVIHLVTCTVLVILWLGIAVKITEQITNQNLVDIWMQNSIPRLVTGVLYYTVLALTYYLALYYRNLNERRNEEVRLKTMVTQAQISYLKAQINPHFLFNSLNSISSLTVTSPQQARDMIARLSDFLRYALTQQEQRFTTLQRELQNIETYLQIEKIRFGSRLVYKTDIAPLSNNALIPPLILQPLIENAIKHGLGSTDEVVHISLNTRSTNNILYIEISNNYDATSKANKGTGIGIKNVSDTLFLYYNIENLLSVHTQANFFTVKLQIPLNQE